MTKSAGVASQTVVLASHRAAVNPQFYGINTRYRTFEFSHFLTLLIGWRMKSSVQPKQTRERASAISLISKSLVNANDDTIAKMLCAAIGHPPVVYDSNRWVRCARCDEVLTPGMVLDSVNLSDEDAILQKLTRKEALYTKTREDVMSM